MTNRLIWITPEAEKTIMYCARVSNPDNQDSEDTRLLNYCIKHGHWSIFEMTNMCVEITASRAISAQITRHRSFVYQEFSQRYAEANETIKTNPRRQDTKNRQNSIDDLSKDTKQWFADSQEALDTMSNHLYSSALSKGIAKECARMLLPMSTQTKLYMNGTIRSWIHYLQLRTDESTQLEHREVALSIKGIFCEQMPIIAKALGWIDKA